MAWAPPALAATTLCLRVSTGLVKATAAVLIIGAILSNAEHPGDPSSWDLPTLQDLELLPLALNETTLSLVAKAAQEDFRRSIVAAYSKQGNSQWEKSLILLRALAAASAPSHPRLKRSTDRCLFEPITASSIDEPLLILDYPPEQFNLCLSNDVLLENLEALLDLPLSSNYSKILKEKLDKNFPLGIPEEQLKCLRSLSDLYMEQEISQWPVTSSDALSVLLSSSGGDCKDVQVQQLLSRYQVLGGSLTGPLLQEIGGENLCKLQEEQIQQIPPEAIGTAGQLNISSCSQSEKEQLYGKAREAFASLASSPGSYYCRIRPYLGGAPAEDLKDLANASEAINMDLGTFLALNPEELQKLSVTDVKNLLGENLPELKKAEKEPSVMSWVERQFQWELDCVLGIGLEGGLQKPTATATPAHTTTSARVTSMATVPTPTHPTTSARVTSTATVPTPTHPTTSARVTSMATTSTPSALSTIPTTSASVTAVPTTIPPVPTRHSTPQSSPAPLGTPTLSSLSPTPPASTTPHTGGPTVPTATPALTTVAPCSTHHSPTTNRATSPAVTLLTTLLATSSPSATSPSSSPVPAVTSRATTSAGVGTNPAGTTHSTVTPASNATSAPTATPVPNPSSAPTATYSTATPASNATSALTATPVPNATSALTATPNTATPVPHSTSAPAATTATHMTPPPHKPTPSPNSTTPTQKSLSSSPAQPTTLPCHTSSHPEFPSPSPTRSSSRETPKPTLGSVPESPPPTSNGYINLQPEAGSGSRLSSCLVHVLAATVGSVLLRGLL